MSYNSLEYFVGRQEEISKFDELLTNDQGFWVILVDGLSGTGKSLLVDWLVKNRCQEICYVRLTLSMSANTYDLMSSIAEQVHAQVSNQFEQELERLRAVEEQQPWLSISIKQETNASTSGFVQGSTQLSSPYLDIGSSAEQILDRIKEYRESSRLDLLTGALAQHLKGKTWVLFIDESSYLDNPELKSFFCQKLFPRLHNLFPHFRLYLTGQSVPTYIFSKHERLESTLDIFQESDIRALSQKAGFCDAKIQKRIFNITLGHPLLTSMMVEHILEHGGKALNSDLRTMESILNEGERTEWIYARILDTITDPGLRQIAANLSLLEWFDLSLLRAIFNSEISEESFNELVRRSFIKPLVGGKWRCHDIIIKYLRPNRQNLLQDNSQEIYLRTFDVLQERITAQEEKEGVWSFRDRINVTSASLSSLLEISVTEAYEYLLTEIALGLYYDMDYLYPLARFIESQPMPDNIQQEIMQAKQCIESLNMEKYNPEVAAFLDRLGQHLYQKGKTSVATKMVQLAAMIYTTIVNNEQALASAMRACDYDNSIENQALVAKIYTTAGKFDAAEEQLSKMNHQFGDQPLIQVERARLACAQDNQDGGLHILFETISRYPQNIQAHIALMNIMMEDGQYEAALSQAEAILVVDPANSEGAINRLLALSLLGRFDEIMPLLRESDLPISKLLDSIALMQGELNDAMMRGRMLAELAVDPESYSPALIINLILDSCIRGDVPHTDQLVKFIENRWPEAMSVCQSARAVARFNAGQIQEAQSLAESQVKRGDGLVDTYITLARCYFQQGSLPEGICLLEECAERFPYSRDLLDCLTARFYLKAKQADKALSYLQETAEDRELGPFALHSMADVYISLGIQDEAIRLLEDLIYTMGRSELPIQELIDVRTKYAIQLARRGDRDKAADIAYNLLSLHVDKTLTAIQAGSVFATLLDEEGVRVAYQSTDNWDSLQRAQFLTWLAQFVLRRNTSIEGILNELAAHPDRLEYILALDIFMSIKGMVGLVNETFQRVEKIAPGMTISYIKMQEDYLVDAGSSQLEQLKNEISRHPENFMLYSALGRIQLKEGLFTEAKQAFTHAVQLNPAYEYVVANWLVIALLDAGELEQVKELLEPFLSQLPPPLPMVNPVSSYLQATGDREAEIKLYNSAAQAYPNLRQTYIERIVDYEIEDGHYEHALEIIAQLSADQELEPGIVLSRINALRELERYEEALASADEMLTVPYQTPLMLSMWWFSRATTCIASGSLDEAEGALLKAVELDNTDAKLHFTLAEVYQQKEEWEMAYQEIMSGLAREPAKLTKYLEQIRELDEKRQNKHNVGTG